jgi:hypothetical protein
VVSKAEKARISVQDEGKAGNFDKVEEEINVRFLFDRDGAGNEGGVDAKLKGRSELIFILKATNRIASGDVQGPSQALVSIPPLWIAMPGLSLPPQIVTT